MGKKNKINWDGKWYSWDNTSGDAVAFDSWKDLITKENYDYLSKYRDSLDIYEAGCLIEVDNFNDDIGYKVFCTLKPGSESEKEALSYGDKPGDLHECSHFSDEGNVKDIKKKFYGVPAFIGIPADVKEDLPQTNMSPNKCLEALKRIKSKY